MNRCPFSAVCGLILVFAVAIHHVGACSSSSTCATCLTDSSCVWCPSPYSAVNPNMCQPTSYQACAGTIYTPSTGCPSGPSCTAISSCSQCSGQSGCEWCNDNGGTCQFSSFYSCSSGSSCSSPAPATPWAGSYTVNAGCDPTTCCCATAGSTVVVTQSGSTVSFTMPVNGVCGGVTSSYGSVTLPSLTATSIVVTMQGQAFTVTYTANLISVVNQLYPSCSATASLQGPAPGPNTPWNGLYTVNAGCDQNTCCCAQPGTGVLVAQSGHTVSFSFAVTGACGSSTTFEASVTLPSLTATTVATTVGGNAYSITYSTGTIYVNNLSYPSCSSTATLYGGNYGFPILSIILFIVVPIVGGLLLIALIVVVIVVCRRRAARARQGAELTEPMVNYAAMNSNQMTRA